MTQGGKKPKFPLPRGYFGDVQLSKGQVDYYRDFCQRQVERGLLDESLHSRNYGRVDSKKWKPVRSQHTFQLYRRRDGGLHENDGKPSMLGVGRVEGSIEDVIYGAYDQTDEELRMTAELVDVDFGDGIVLSNMEQGSPTDPYRYLGIKWILTPFPMPALMPDRDWVLLESAGIAKDADGRRYGYHTLFTVDLPQCPEFPDVIRGTMWYTFIFRDAGRGMIDVHSQGYFDCKGDLLDPLTIVGSTQMFNGVFRYMKSSEAKKLTIMALENLERKITMGFTPIEEGNILPTTACSICHKQRSSLPFSSRRMRICRVCDNVVCMNCRIKKNILIGRQRVMSKVSVCQQCIAHAKSLVVDPANEKYVISREMQLGERNQPISSAIHSLCGGQHNFGTLVSRKTTREFGASRLGTSTAEHNYWSRSNDDRPTRTRTERPGSGQHERTVIHEPFQTARPTSMSVPTHVPVSVAASRSKSLGQDVDTETVVDDQTSLYEKMRQLQESARRAHELTEASRAAMVESSIGLARAR